MLQSNTKIIANINEYFSSIQGEGIFIGEPHFFIRFSGCNLSCDYCDTDHAKIVHRLDVDTLVKKCIASNVKKISLTGGEPLLQDLFLKEFLPYIKKHKRSILLETNGILYKELLPLIKYIDVVSMDLKLQTPYILEQLKFADIASKKYLYFKAVISINDSKDMIVDYLKHFNRFRKCSLILQPESSRLHKNTDYCLKILNSIDKYFDDIRIIPQVHKWLNLK